MLGIFAAASFDERPLSQSDLSKLAIEKSHSTHFAYRISDSSTLEEPFSNGQQVAILHGELDDESAARERLGLSKNALPAEIASRALDQWGNCLSLELPGFWTLLRWDGATQELSVTTSFRLRDPVVFASEGAKFALAPNATALCRLDWITRDIDPEKFALSAMPWAKRRDHPDPTFIKNVERLRPGAVYRFDASGFAFADRPYHEVHPFLGTFQDGVAELEQAARAAMRRILDRHGTMAVSLSGGLDSSLVALLAVQEARAGQRIFAVSSVASVQSKAADERRYIDLVADALGIQIIYVAPPMNMEFLRPHHSTMAMRDSPAMPSNHFVYRHLIEAAAAEGASACIGGEFGEGHFSRMVVPRKRANWLRAMKRFASERVHNRQPASELLFWPSAEIAKLAAQLEHGLPQTRGATALQPGKRFGPDALYDKIGRQSSRTTCPEVRYYRIFETPELFRVSAGFPRSFAEHAGQSRALVRSILARYLPDAVAYRQDIGPISPDLQFRMSQLIEQAQSSVQHYEQWELGQWVNIDRISEAFRRIQNGDPQAAIHELRQLQSTINAAEFTAWWLSGQ